MGLVNAYLAKQLSIKAPMNNIAMLFVVAPILKIHN